MEDKKIKIGILGGSFDPAHKGHLAISKEAIKKFKLKEVIWAITKKNPFKKKSNSKLSIRIQHCKSIIGKISLIKVKFYEKKIGSNKTIDLINYLTKNKKTAIQFLKNVKSSIAMHNTSTQFADGGEFGFGGEVGISTNTLPPRGPVGLDQLVSFKYEVSSRGKIRD